MVTTHMETTGRVCEGDMAHVGVSHGMVERRKHTTFRTRCKFEIKNV